MHSLFSRLGLVLLLAGRAAYGQYNISNDREIKASAKTIAFDLMSYYSGNQSGQVPGVLPGPPPKGDYFWWEGGALMGAMIDYWQLTGDATYNDVVMQGLLHQVGDNRDYQPLNQTANLGNDDQGFWGMSAMLAAETNFPNPPDGQPQWLALAQAVFNTQQVPSRHDDTCGGGMRWQIQVANSGYAYKNSIVNGIFFNLGARLARYTGNATYANVAEDTWDWLTRVGLIDSIYNVYDGAHVQSNCTEINKALFSYNYGVLILGVANMYNFTNGAPKWKERLEGLVNATMETFFVQNSVMREIACEPYNTCTADMLTYKGLTHRWLTTATTLAPVIRESVLPVLRKSATAAVTTCTGGKLGRQCGFKWTTRRYDGTTGVGQQMNVLGAITSLLQEKLNKAPFTSSTGGTSVGNPGAGLPGDINRSFPPITAGDRAGASLITIAGMFTAAAVIFWLWTDWTEPDWNKDGAAEAKEKEVKEKEAKPEEAAVVTAAAAVTATATATATAAKPRLDGLQSWLADMINRLSSFKVEVQKKMREKTEVVVVDDSESGGGSEKKSKIKISVLPRFRTGNAKE